MAYQNKVLVNIEQNLSPEEKSTARKNIGVSDVQLPDITDAEHGDVLTVIRSGAYGIKSVTWQQPAKSPKVSCRTIENIVWNGPVTSDHEQDVYSITVAANDWAHWTLCGNLLSSGSVSNINGVFVRVYKDDVKVYDHQVWMPRIGTDIGIIECPFSVTGAFTNLGDATATYRIVISNASGVNSLLQATNLKLTLLNTGA